MLARARCPEMREARDVNLKGGLTVKDERSDITTRVEELFAAVSAGDAAGGG